MPPLPTRPSRFSRYQSTSVVPYLDLSDELVVLQFASFRSASASRLNAGQVGGGSVAAQRSGGAQASRVERGQRVVERN
jgi:hypothetical protein